MVDRYQHGGSTAACSVGRPAQMTALNEIVFKDENKVVVFVHGNGFFRRRSLTVTENDRVTISSFNNIYL